MGEARPRMIELLNDPQEPSIDWTYGYREGRTKRSRTIYNLWTVLVNRQRKIERLAQELGEAWRREDALLEKIEAARNEKCDGGCECCDLILAELG